MLKHCYPLLTDHFCFPFGKFLIRVTYLLLSMSYLFDRVFLIHAQCFISHGSDDILFLPITDGQSKFLFLTFLCNMKSTKKQTNCNKYFIKLSSLQIASFKGKNNYSQCFWLAFQTCHPTNIYIFFFHIILQAFFIDHDSSRLMISFLQLSICCECLSVSISMGDH